MSASVSLPDADIAYLAGLDIEHQIEAEAGMTCVVLRDWPLPAGFNHSTVDLLVRLTPGYPDVAPDMWWFSPAVYTAAGAALPNTGATGSYLGRQWQRWSRHLSADQWRSGIDGLESYVALIRSDLERWIPAAA